MSCGRKGTVSRATVGPSRRPPRPAAHLVDDLLLLGVLLPQAGHLPPQGLVLAGTHRVRSDAPAPPSPAPGRCRVWGVGACRWLGAWL